MTKIFKSSFSQMLVGLNRLDFKRWIFKRGMEFWTNEKWWQTIYAAVISLSQDNCNLDGRICVVLTDAPLSYDAEEGFRK